MTKYPKSGKGNKWTAKELEAINSAWDGFTLSDGNSLSGKVKVTSNNDITIKFRYGFRFNLKKSWYYCGTYPSSSIAEIRDERDLARNALKNGIDPRVHKKAKKIEAQLEAKAVVEADAKEKSENLTFQNLFDIWVKEGVNHSDGNKTIKLTFKKHILPTLGKKFLRVLSEKHLESVYREIIATGKNRTAVVLSDTIKQMLSWAEKRQPWRRLLINGNPSLLVNMNILLPTDYEEERERFLSKSEIKKLDFIFKNTKIEFEKAKNKYKLPKPINESTVIALWISLSTLCRMGELLMAEWTQVSFSKKTWFIPKENVKGSRNKKQDHTIFLSDFALTQLKKLHLLSGKTKWLFPSSDAKKHVFVKSISKQVGDRQIMFKNRTKNLSHRVNSNLLVVGNEDWTPHDMRRTGTTMMQELRVSLDTIDRCQNHILAGGKIRKNYMLYDYEKEMKAAWQKLGSALSKLIT